MNNNNSNRTDGWCKFFAKKIASKQATLASKAGQEWLKIFEEILKVFVGMSKNAMRNVGGPSSLTNISTNSFPNNCSANFASLKDVALMLIMLFCDYIHDHGDYRSIFRNMGNNANSVENVFIRWITTISWLDTSLKTPLITLIQGPDGIDILNILLYAFKGSKSPDEHEIISGLFSFMRHENKKPAPFSKYSIDGAKQALGGAKVHVVFDQTSKASGPGFTQTLTPYNRNTPGKILKNIDHNVLYDICLPAQADQGSSFASNPLLLFIDLLHEFCKKVYEASERNVKNYSTDPGVMAIFRQIHSKFVPNFSDTFTVHFTHGGSTVLKYKYFYNPNGEILVDLNGVGTGTILSAKSIQGLDVSRAMFKTAGDLGMTLYSIISGSIISTGDRASFCTAAFLAYLLNFHRRLVINSRGAFLRIMYEYDSQNVLVNKIATQPWARNVSAQNINLYAPNKNGLSFDKRYVQVRQKIAPPRQIVITRVKITPAQLTTLMLKRLKASTENVEKIKSVVQNTRNKNSLKKAIVYSSNSLLARYIKSNINSNTFEKQYLIENANSKEKLKKSASNMNSFTAFVTKQPNMENLLRRFNRNSTRVYVRNLLKQITASRNISNNTKRTSIGHILTVEETPNNVSAKNAAIQKYLNNAKINYNMTNNRRVVLRKPGANAGGKSRRTVVRTKPAPY